MASSLILNLVVIILITVSDILVNLHIDHGQQFDPQFGCNHPNNCLRDLVNLQIDHGQQFDPQFGCNHP